jgi:hypothetical protein
MHLWDLNRLSGPFPRLCIIHRYLAAPECFMCSLFFSAAPSSRSFFFFYLLRLSSSTRQSSRRVSFQRPARRKRRERYSVCFLPFRISTIAPYITIFRAMKISMNSATRGLLNICIHYGALRFFQRTLYSTSLTDCLEGSYVTISVETRGVYVDKNGFKFGYVYVRANSNLLVSFENFFCEV